MKNKKGTALAAVNYLKGLYPDAVCSLDADDPFRLIVATRLSAQCTDARVNTVTPALFARYPDPAAMAAADPADVEKLIQTCGFYHTKAGDLVAMAGRLVSDFGGRVPDTMEELTSLPGVGRKTANLILGDVYHKPAIVCDTHLIRLANRLALVDTKDPAKVEKELLPLLPPEESSDFCHRAVLFGRDICPSRSPQCERCGLHEYCAFYAENCAADKKRS